MHLGFRGFVHGRAACDGAVYQLCLVGWRVMNVFSIGALMIK